MKTTKSIRCYHGSKELKSLCLNVDHLTDDDINARLYHLNNDYQSLTHVLCEEPLPLRDQLKLIVNPLFERLRA